MPALTSTPSEKWSDMPTKGRLTTHIASTGQISPKDGKSLKRLSPEAAIMHYSPKCNHGVIKFLTNIEWFIDSPEGSNPSNSNEKGSLYSSQILAEDMGLEIEADLWTR